MENNNRRKIINGFYLKREDCQGDQLGVQDPDNERVYVYLYDRENDKMMGQWRNTSDFVNR